MWFEWKKLFERRLNVTAMILGYVLIGVCVAVWISDTSFYDDKTQDYIEGVNAVRRDQQRAGAQTDSLSEEYITQLVREIQSHHLDLESDEAYVEVIRPLGDLFWVKEQKRRFGGEAGTSWAWYGIWLRRGFIWSL